MSIHGESPSREQGPTNGGGTNPFHPWASSLVGPASQLFPDAAMDDVVLTFEVAACAWCKRSFADSHLTRVWPSDQRVCFPCIELYRDEVA